MLKNKLSITSLGLAGFIIIYASYLFASYFFKVTNSNIYDIVSPRQSQIGFEDNEFVEINKFIHEQTTNLVPKIYFYDKNLGITIQQDIGHENIYRKYLSRCHSKHAR